MISYYEYILEAVESKDSTFEQRDKALKAAIDLFLNRCGCNSADKIDEYYERIMDVCMGETSRRRATNEPSRVTNADIGDALMRCIASGPDSLYPRMIDHETAMPFIFDCILSADDKEHKPSVILLGFLVEFAEPGDRLALRIRYFSGLRNAMFSILLRGTHLRDCEYHELFETKAMLGVICTYVRPYHQEGVVLDKSIVIKYALHLPSFCKWLSQRFNQRGIPEMIILALEATLDSPTTLEMLLGYGLLKVSHYFSRLPINRSSVRTANVFSAVLARHPEWNQLFKKWTSDGDAVNPTAVLGRSIPLRPPSEGAQYILNEEVDQI